MHGHNAEAQQLPTTATSGAGVAEADSPNLDGLESATSVQGPVASSAAASAPFARNDTRRVQSREYAVGPHGFDPINCPSYYDGCNCEPAQSETQRIQEADDLLRRAITHCHGNAYRMRKEFAEENGEQLFAEALQVVVDIQAYFRRAPSPSGVEEGK